jgi:branched-chain amino acid transport system ATP-binding protein
MSDTLLSVSSLYKSFGGIVATDNLSIDVADKEVHAVIGPNGAGKTTLIAQLTGELIPDAGQVTFSGVDITRWPPYRRAHLGLARSFQITSIFHELRVIDNVALAVQAHTGHSYRFWKPAQTDTALLEPAAQALAAVGLTDRARVLARGLSHGEHRQLEIAMALATKPRLLLLDEPMAGMGPEETAAMVEILRGLKAHRTILLIEHDMDAVFALADRITVLVYGQVIASGPPERIRADPQVRSAYLGDEVSDVA